MTNTQNAKKKSPLAMIIRLVVLIWFIIPLISSLIGGVINSVDFSSGRTEDTISVDSLKLERKGSEYNGQSAGEGMVWYEATLKVTNSGSDRLYVYESTFEFHTTDNDGYYIYAVIGGWIYDDEPYSGYSCVVPAGRTADVTYLIAMDPEAPSVTVEWNSGREWTTREYKTA